MWIKSHAFNRAYYCIFVRLSAYICKKFQISVSAVIRKKSGSFNNQAYVFRHIFFAYNLISDGDTSACNRNKSAYAFHKHCFSAAVSADQTMYLSFFKVNAYVIKYRIFLKFFCYIFYFNHHVLLFHCINRLLTSEHKY